MQVQELECVTDVEGVDVLVLDSVDFTKTTSQLSETFEFDTKSSQIKISVLTSKTDSSTCKLGTPNY